MFLVLLKLVKNKISKFYWRKPIYSELNELDFINFVMISEAAAEKYLQNSQIIKILTLKQELYSH